MSNSADVAQLYKNVIEEVIKTVRTDFINMGVDEQVLVDLQSLWEQKLIEAKVFRPQDFPITAAREYSTAAGFFYSPSAGIRPVYGTSAASMPMGPAYSLPATAVPSQYSASYYAQSRPTLPIMVVPPAVGGSTMPFPTMNSAAPAQAPALANQARQSAALSSSANDDSSVATSSSSAPPRVNFGQYDGADDINILEARLTAGSDVIIDLHCIPQLDGADNRIDAEGEVKNDQEAESKEQKPADIHLPLEIRTEELSSKRPRSEDELGSDLDDTESDADKGEDDENINDLILCQYEKISRVRTRWRGVLRAGIIHVNGSDYCFGRANTDFDW